MGVNEVFGQASQLAEADARWAIFLTIAAVGIALLLSFAITRFLRTFVKNTAMGRLTIVEAAARALIALMTFYFLGENVLHLELNGLLSALGITTVIVSFGLQDLIRNLVAGAQIVGEGLFSVQDQLERSGIRAEVMDIGWRQTILRDKDGNSHVIANAALMDNSFMRFEGKMARRYLIDCDIKPGLDLDRVSEDICSLADAVLDERGMRAEEHSEVRYLGSTANGVKASIRIYLKDIVYTVPGSDAVMRAIGQRGYLADWTNDNPAQNQWR